MTTKAAAIEWTPDLSVGIEALDDDHKTVFVVVDLMQSVLREEPPLNLEAILRCLLKMLQEYICGHFLREERAMEMARFPGLEEHRGWHDAFRTKIERFVEDYNKIRDHGEHKKAAQHLADIVQCWCVDHIAKSDKSYADYLRPEHVDPRPLVFLCQEADTSGEADDFDLIARNSVSPE
ncbi:MAG: hemerythrin family protein [Alphaproteobacteria bacterium]|nr:hemerythrin family protein [Alphaproteobacteria bacterium]